MRRSSITVLTIALLVLIVTLNCTPGTYLVGRSTPTNTPTKTRQPTFTITPTVTSTPTATRTPLPTNTPLPTDTPTPTDTPLATDTPVATNTPVPPPTRAAPPTDTPVPTDTPLPTDTPFPYEFKLVEQLTKKTSNLDVYFYGKVRDADLNPLPGYKFAAVNNTTGKRYEGEACADTFAPDVPQWMDPTDYIRNCKLTNRDVVGDSSWEIYVTDGAGNIVSEKVPFQTSMSNPLKYYFDFMKVK